MHRDIAGTDVTLLSASELSRLNRHVLFQIHPDRVSSSGLDPCVATKAAQALRACIDGLKQSSAKGVRASGTGSAWFGQAAAQQQADHQPWSAPSSGPASHTAQAWAGQPPSAWGPSTRWSGCAWTSAAPKGEAALRAAGGHATALPLVPGLLAAPMKQSRASHQGVRHAELAVQGRSCPSTCIPWHQQSE
ncbi:hypothetical protein HaLaN_08081 [Haematococcus lacustris]|uniref:Uncharacterized protein n=1 Tax=Haematococcus lacustris TaxID=44745 RepID=A0A699YS00_HAELA|nr:hypothetical protein HaLaN_08081 [Haematococcus lacustris]